jgi:hypothetical protein
MHAQRKTLVERYVAAGLVGRQGTSSNSAAAGKSRSRSAWVLSVSRGQGRHASVCPSSTLFAAGWNAHMLEDLLLEVPPGIPISRYATGADVDGSGGRACS